jgi:signal transduction histidine kinase
MPKPEVIAPVSAEDSEHNGSQNGNASELQNNGLKQPTSADSPKDRELHDSEVVYRRLSPSTDNINQSRPGNIRERAREIAPTVGPLLIGFTLLLGLILVLGYLSGSRMDQVNNAFLDLERQHSARLGLLLQLRLAATKLNNEARLRHEAESRRELKPPFDFRLSTAREEVVRLLSVLDQTRITEDPDWQKITVDLRSFVEVTEDLRRYSLEGFSKFEAVDQELDALLAKTGPEQEQIIAKSEVMEEEARRSISLWTFLALLVGAIVAAATIWEVQRWFRRMRVSMFETQRERAFTTQLLEGMVSAVAAIDENDRIRSANAAFFKIFPRASIGESVFEKFGNDDAMRMLEAASATRVETETYRGRFVSWIEADKIRKTFDVYSSPLAINGDRGQILTLVDATEATESERVLRRSESLAAVGRATTQVAHEIRNPLGSIRLGVSMLRDSVAEPEALRTIELVERGIKHLNKLVVDVTQFSRQKALDRSDVDLHELIERSLDLVADRVKDKHTPIEKSFAEHRLVGNWDADQLRQVFVNVMANAIDASPERAPLKIVTNTVSLDGNEDGAPRRFAQVTIADQGGGMDQATIDRIFEPFFSTKKRGTGLGLAIVKQIVEQHGGKIAVDSEPEKGSRVVIDLPL